MFRKTFTYDGERQDIRAHTEEELAVKVAMRKRDLEEGKKKISKNMLVREWSEEFLTNYKKKSVSPETYDDYNSRLKSKILPVLGSMQLKDVKPIHCQKVLNGMEGNSKTYISKVQNTMYQMFRRALQNNLIIVNPAEDLEVPDGEDGSNRAITETERECTYKVAEYHRGGLWVLTMLLMGLRPSETAALQGRHLDFKKRAITVEFAVKKKDKRIGKTKTETSTRKVPMPDELYNKFKALKVEPFGYVFTNTEGNRLSKTNMRIMWNNFKREMNIVMGCKVHRNQVLKPYRVADDLVPYCYRHTFCTDLEAAGVSLNEAARLMGHKNVAVTSKIYTHESEASFERVSEQLNKYRKESKKKSAKKFAVDMGVETNLLSIEK